MAWQGIEGHDEVARRFAAVAARGRVGGSYLFVGPSGVGKSTFARALAKSLACREIGAGLVPCGGCPSCAQAEAGSHPDIDVVGKPEDRATIPLDLLIGDDKHRMREGFCWRLLLRPLVAARKTAILLDADFLSVEGANCLLKTLEEPPDGAVIVLVGTAPERQLPTIRSRCQTIRFAPLAADVVRRILEQENAVAPAPVDAAAIRAAAEAAGGSLTRARLLLDPDVATFRAALVAALGQRPVRGVELARDTLALIDGAGKESAPRRARLRIVLETASDFLRAAMRQAAAGEQPRDPLVARALSGATPDLDEILALLRLTLAAAAQVDRNANPAMLVDAWTAMLEEPRLAQAARLA